jgi:hypothetical protein
VLFLLMLWRILAWAHPTSYNKVFVQASGIDLCNRAEAIPGQPFETQGKKARRYKNRKITSHPWK